MSVFRRKLMLEARKLIEGRFFFNQPDNEIWYVTTDGKVCTQLSNVGGWTSTPINNTFVSNTYENGMGRVVFENPLVTLGEQYARYKNNLHLISLPKTFNYIQSFNNGFGTAIPIQIWQCPRVRLDREFHPKMNTLYVPKGATIHVNGVITNEYKDKIIEYVL